MNAIEIVAASAGTGKTHRLTEYLERQVATAAVRPDAIVATTFTLKAAAELRERLRGKLLEAGESEAAQRLGAARVGTVNAICTQLIADYAMDLGLPPTLRVLDDTVSARFLSASQSMAVGVDQETRLTELERLLSLSWREHCTEIVDLARANNIKAEYLVDSARRSRDGLFDILGAAGDGDDIDRGLLEALRAFEAVAAANQADGTNVTAGAVSVVRSCRRTLEERRKLRWKDWIKLGKLKTSRKSEHLALPVHAAAARHAQHPLLREHLAHIIEQTFDVAAKVLKTYEGLKGDHGALDFIDQEVKALELLRRDDVAARLRQELDLVVVDEFQDTNPLQLAVFARLGALAPRSVWVGDQKQAIYGFRGADPALMDACIGRVLGGDEPTTLEKSYRSRPALVDLTSALFVPPFSDHGIPEGRVRITSAIECDEQALGPIVEHWRWSGRPSKAADSAAIANGVHELLEETGGVVRDAVSGDARPIHRGDIAILCRTNHTCESVAAALHAAGIKAVLPEARLLTTPEVAVALAGLRLWIDPRDSLAAAILARLVEHDTDGDAWLASAVRSPGADAFSDIEAVSSIRALRDRTPHLGPIAALDAIVECTQLRELCLRWGGSRKRLANLEALRGRAVRYAREESARGQACTPLGFVHSLDDTDKQAELRDDDAVVVSTWHGAKGLEWPVVVLHELDKRELGPYGVEVTSDRSEIDLDDPLGDRWIRFWPNPYDDRNTNTPIGTLLEAQESVRVSRQRQECEDLRLLYVAWTRGRDRVVVTSQQGKLTTGRLGALAVGAECMIAEPDPGIVGNVSTTWAGVTFDLKLRDLATTPRGGIPTEAPDIWYVPAGPAPHPPATRQPSGTAVHGEAAAAIGDLVRIGGCKDVRGNPDMQHLGEALHGFLAADRASYLRDERLEMAQGLLDRWQVATALEPDDMLAAADDLKRWTAVQWPEAAWHREWPLHHRLDDGSVVSGRADLVLDIGEGFVLIDHKTFSEREQQTAEKARTFVGQLDAYSEAIRAATGRAVVMKVVHFPVSGIVVPVG